jgi:hypothetical protein
MGRKLLRAAAAAALFLAIATTVPVHPAYAGAGSTLTPVLPAGVCKIYTVIDSSGQATGYFVVARGKATGEKNTNIERITAGPLPANPDPDLAGCTNGGTVLLPQ